MDITDKIIEIEYRMFDQVNQGGPRAACQDDKETFYAMRRCQFAAWNERMQASYFADLKQAEAAGTNLLTEKYARMMKYTAPEEYRQIEGRLRPVSAEKETLVEQIHEIAMEWTRQLSCQFPCVASGGRSLDEDEASRFGGTSISTYLLGELLTYSENTLREYLAWQQELLCRGENMTRAILEETVRHYGFVSLDAAEMHYRETALRCSNLST